MVIGRIVNLYHSSHNNHLYMNYVLRTPCKDSGWKDGRIQEESFNWLELESIYFLGELYKIHLSREKLFKEHLEGFYYILSKNLEDSIERSLWSHEEPELRKLLLIILSLQNFSFTSFLMFLPPIAARETLETQLAEYQTLKTLMPKLPDIDTEFVPFPPELINRLPKAIRSILEDVALCYRVGAFASANVMLRKVVVASISLRFKQKFGNDKKLRNHDGYSLNLKTRIEKAFEEGFSQRNITPRQTNWLVWGCCGS